MGQQAVKQRKAQKILTPIATTPILHFHPGHSGYVTRRENLWACQRLHAYLPTPDGKFRIAAYTSRVPNCHVFYITRTRDSVFLRDSKGFLIDASPPLRLFIARVAARVLKLKHYETCKVYVACQSAD